MPFPAVYVPPRNTPLYWRDERGILRAAVEAYLDNRVKGTPIAPADVELVRDYLEYWISAPCWDDGQDEEIRAEFRTLREKVKTLKNADEIQDWIFQSLDLGIDPL